MFFKDRYYNAAFFNTACLFLCLTFSNHNFSQSNKEINTVIDHIIGLDYNTARLKLNTFENKDLKNDLVLFLNILKHRGQNKTYDSIQLVKQETKIKRSENQDIIFNLSKAYSYLYNSKNFTLSIKYANNAYLQSVKSKKNYLTKLSLICILEIYRSQPVLSTQKYLPYLKEFENKRKSHNDSIAYTYYQNEFASLSYPLPDNYQQTSQVLYNKYNEKISPHYKARYAEAIGVNFRINGVKESNEKKLDSAIKFFKYVTSLDDEAFLRPYKFHSFLELGHLYALSDNREKAYSYRDKALNYLDKADTLISLYQYHKWDAYYIHEVLKDLDNSFYALDKAFLLSTDLNFFNETKLLAELNVELNTAEKEKQLLIEKQKKKQNRNIAFGLGGSLLLFSVIGFLFYNNRKRKQELILQEQLLRQEQLKSQLKEEELKSVDAMIEGQEKERLNIANELHDELGSLMTTIKMHFSNLNIDAHNESYTKTNALLDNAYHKIRNISHAKNAGVLAEKGLFKAVNDLTKNISISNQINIKVYGNANQQRLSNSLELTIFRAIQELITNILKHAKASLVEIYLTIDQVNLNILIEDNGIGFLPEKSLKNNSGIGLKSIEKRIENLGGSFIVESQLNRGTSVIIDVPIN